MARAIIEGAIRGEVLQSDQIAIAEPEEIEYIKDIEKLIKKKIEIVSKNPFPQTDKPMSIAEKKKLEIILGSKSRLKTLVRRELEDDAKLFNDERQSPIKKAEDAKVIDELIPLNNK